MRHIRRTLIIAAVTGAMFLGLLPAHASTAEPLVDVLSSDYDAQNDIHVVVGTSDSGDIDVYYGQHKDWTKLQDNRDIDNRYSPEEFVDFSIGDSDAMYGVAVGTIEDYKIGFRQYAPRCTSINAREFYGKPWFGDGKPEAIGDLETCLSVDYDPSNNIFVVVGEAAGQIDVYYGQHKDWTKLQENRDIDNRYSPEEFVDFSIGDGDAKYGVAVGTRVLDVNPLNGSSNVDRQPRCTSISARDFSDKPYFGDGRPEVVADDLARCLSLDYDASNDLYVLVGENTDGQIDVYYGQHNDWVKLQENRDIDNRYSPEEFVDFSIGDGDAMYGVAVGTIEDYKIGFRQYAPRGTSINAREFYDKPWFGDGKPKAISG